MGNMTIMTNDSVILRTTTQKNSAPLTRYAACSIVEMQGTTP